MPTSILTSKGQATIPQEVREALHLKPGDQLEFVIESDGRVVLRPAQTDLIALDGLLDRSGSPPVSIETMQKIIEQRASESSRSSS